MTLLIAATLTWYTCSGVLPWEYLGDGVNGAVAPLFSTAQLAGSTGLVWLLGFGTLFATLASANGCINDASRAWFAMGRDGTCPAGSAPCIRATARPTGRSSSWCRSR
jgi:ethanolamine permease